MTRGEIRKIAKDVVINFGPAQAQEFTTELAARIMCIREGDLEEHPDRDAILAEVNHQADRVYRFLGE